MHLNAEFQIIARRDKKAFLSDQCKEIEENNRMGKTRDLFKKIRDTKGTFHAKMGTIKERNAMDLQKQKIVRRGGKNTGVDCHSLLQGELLDPGIKTGSPALQADSLLSEPLRTQTNYTKKVLMTRITMLVWSVQSQTFLSVKLRGPSQALLLVKLVEVMEFQQSCLKS